LECPCKNCICLSVCRHKYYTTMFNYCIFITDYLPYNGDWNSRSQTKLLKIYNILSPTKWNLINKHFNKKNKRLWVESISER